MDDAEQRRIVALTCATTYLARKAPGPGADVIATALRYQGYLEGEFEPEPPRMSFEDGLKLGTEVRQYLAARGVDSRWSYAVSRRAGHDYLSLDELLDLLQEPTSRIQGVGTTGWAVLNTALNGTVA